MWVGVFFWTQWILGLIKNEILKRRKLSHRLTAKSKTVHRIYVLSNFNHKRYNNTTKIAKTFNCLTFPSFPGKWLPRSKQQPKQPVSHVCKSNSTTHLAMMVRRMLGHRPGQLSHFYLFCQVALQTREHHLTLTRLEAFHAAITQPH